MKYFFHNFHNFSVGTAGNSFEVRRNEKNPVPRAEKGQNLRNLCLHLEADSAIIHSILCPGGRKLSNYGGNPGYKSNYRGRFLTRPVKI